MSRPADRAHAGIRQRILEGALAPGAHLAEESLAALTGTSRTPVRRALERLVGEGLVVIGANGRAHVADAAPREAAIVFGIRARLESFAAELACRAIDAAALDGLADIADRIEALGSEVSQDNVARFLDLNTAFHQRILAAAGSRHLSAALAPAFALPLVLLKHHVWSRPVNIVRSNRQHREIIEALRQRNVAWAGACMAAHIYATRPSGAEWEAA